MKREPTSQAALTLRAVLVAAAVGLVLGVIANFFVDNQGPSETIQIIDKTGIPRHMHVGPIRLYVLFPLVGAFGAFFWRQIRMVFKRGR
jgi:hypothetical protein